MYFRALKILIFSAAFAAGGPAGAQTSERLDETQLRQIESEITAARERGTALESEIETLIKESNALSERLVLMAARVQAREARITAGEEKLEGLDLEERALKDKLRRQHKMLGHLLAGLQRLEQDPPPALVVKPDDAVAALRGAMLLGAIVPELKDEASAISKSLNRLVNLRAAIVRERANVERNIAALSKERSEIESLLTQKTQVEARAREELKITRQRADVLAKKAKTVRQLMAELVKKREEAKKAAMKAEKKRLEKLAEKQRIAEEKRKEKEKRRIAALMRPKFKFSKAKGQLAYPVQGERVANFGSAKRDGSKSKGLSIATRSHAQVISPADGAIEFAGDFRTYGKLLIINAGEGYYLLLAGLGEITVSAGQAIRAGEPVGTMGSNAALGVTGSKSGDSRAVLYVEFRRNDKSIDPRPWWAGRTNDKVRG
ncbi:MAG: murein hydrolase activator EnvC family protein [Hyphomicrobiales bacterium]